MKSTCVSRRHVSVHRLTVLLNRTDRKVPCALSDPGTGEVLISNDPVRQAGLLQPCEATVYLA